VILTDYLDQFYNAAANYASEGIRAGMERQVRLDAGDITDEEGLFHEGMARASTKLDEIYKKTKVEAERLEAAFNARTAAGPVGQSETSNVSSETVESVQKQRNPRYRLLDDAWNAVSRTEYGGVEQNFDRIAELWNAWIAMRGIGIEPGEWKLVTEDVAVMLILFKVARLASSIDHHDSIVDIAGYAACLAEIVEES
jgi:hypothetical protein